MPDENERAPAPITAADALAQQAIDTYWEGRFGAALELAEAAIAAAPNYYRGYGVKGLTLLALGQADEALAAVREGIARAPHIGALFSIAGLCYARLKDDEAAVAAFQRGIALSPDDDRVYYNFACYWAQLGNGPECRRYLAEGLARQPALVRLVLKDADFARFAGEPWFRDLLAAYKSKKAKEANDAQTPR